MSRHDARSRVRKRRKGCLTGCLTRLLLLLGVLSLIFVGACVLGFVKNDPQTGAPSISFENVGIENLPQIDLGNVELPDVSGVLEGLSLPTWAYSVNRSGLTVKTLRAGDGEAVLVCSDGYTMLVGAGSGSGLMVNAQMLLSGVNRLSAAVAMSSADEQIGGMAMVLSMARPGYLFYQDSQVKGGAYNAMLDRAAQQENMTGIVPEQGLAFTLGRAQVTFIGPARTHHTDERDDGLSLRIDYGNTSVVIMGAVTAAGEREIVSSGVPLSADALICARGGSDAATCLELVNAVGPSVALMTGKEPANSVRIRLEKAGAAVYTAQDNGVMTLFSDGQTLRVVP